MTSQTSPLSNNHHLNTGFQDPPPTSNNASDTDNAYQIKLPDKLVNNYSITTDANVKACFKFTPEDFGYGDSGQSASLLVDAAVFDLFRQVLAKFCSPNTLLKLKCGNETTSILKCSYEEIKKPDDPSTTTKTIARLHQVSDKKNLITITLYHAKSRRIMFQSRSATIKHNMDTVMKPLINLTPAAHLLDNITTDCLECAFSAINCIIQEGRNTQIQVNCTPTESTLSIHAPLDNLLVDAILQEDILIPTASPSSSPRLTKPSPLSNNITSPLKRLEQEVSSCKSSLHKISCNLEMEGPKMAERLEKLEKSETELRQKLTAAEGTIKSLNESVKKLQTDNFKLSSQLDKMTNSASVLHRLTSIEERLNSIPPPSTQLQPPHTPVPQPNTVTPPPSTPSHTDNASIIMVDDPAPAVNGDTSRPPPSPPTRPLMSVDTSDVTNYIIGGSNLFSISNFIKNRTDKLIIQATSGATFSSMCEQVKTIKRCNILMLQGGTNDAAQLNNPHDAVPDLHKLLKCAGEVAQRVILVAPPPTSPASIKMEEIMYDEACQFNVEFIHVSHTFPTSGPRLIKSDSLHCTRRGAGYYGLAVINYLSNHSDVISDTSLLSCIDCHRAGHNFTSCPSHNPQPRPPQSSPTQQSSPKRYNQSGANSDQRTSTIASQTAISHAPHSGDPNPRRNRNFSDHNSRHQHNTRVNTQRDYRTGYRNVRNPRPYYPRHQNQHPSSQHRGFNNTSRYSSNYITPRDNGSTSHHQHRWRNDYSPPQHKDYYNGYASYRRNTSSHVDPPRSRQYSTVYKNNQSRNYYDQPSVPLRNRFDVLDSDVY